MSLGVSEAAGALLASVDAVAAREPLTKTWPELDVATAYAIQDESLRKRRVRGETLIGLKLGLTSRAKQQRMGIDSPLLAWLTDAMVLPAGVPVPLGGLIHPRAEPEIVFVMGQRLSGPGVTAATALAAVDRVHAGVEIIDSRFEDYKFKLPDAVADNGSSALFGIGPVGVRPEKLDLSLEACLLEVDGHVVDTATGAAVQGHPAEALALAANALAARGLAIEPGWIILTGGMTDAVPLTPGSRVAAHFSNLGSVTLSA
ncbi:2-keto-4-pentenoate hydratase [Amycolatopsis sp. NPDC059657]|uniref:2-keto-4-pentenoate hydratase n=1 Tax=Amycolatopsis sp. NPDC059657 TaxID=3346899 RepID=UPI00367220AB